MSKTSIANEAMLKEKGYDSLLSKQKTLISQHYAEKQEDMAAWDAYAARVKQEYPTAS